MGADAVNDPAITMAPPSTVPMPPGEGRDVTVVPQPDGTTPSESETLGYAGSSGPARAGQRPPKRYPVLSRLGQTGMGVVFEVWERDPEPAAGHEVIRCQESPGTSSVPVDPHLFARFVREAEITGQLDHPGVVPVHHLGTDGRGRTYFRMRRVRGESLGSVFEKARQGDATGTQTRVLDVLVRVCETLAFAYSRGVSALT